MFANNSKDSFNIDKIYKINNFTNICGSNRFFKSSFLKNLFIKRFNRIIKSLPLKHFMINKIVNETFINKIILNMKKQYNIWNILPKFLGIHRIYTDNNQYISNYLRNFYIYEIPQCSSIKYIHSSNHSCNKMNEIKDANSVQNNIIIRYKKENIISPDDDGLSKIPLIIPSFF
jgi:hypothetical protein